MVSRSERRVVTSDLASFIACNCSMCSRAGTVLTLVPVDQFKLQLDIKKVDGRSR